MIDKAKLLRALEDLRIKCRANIAPILEDAVLELMDRVEGWCSPDGLLSADQPPLCYVGPDCTGCTGPGGHNPPSDCPLLAAMMGHGEGE